MAWFSPESMQRVLCAPVLIAECSVIALRPSLQPACTSLDPSVPHAPTRTPNLTPSEFRLAVKNALRYFPKEHHAVLAPEFADELRNEGHIYMRRFAPTEYNMQAYDISLYPAAIPQARAPDIEACVA